MHSNSYTIIFTSIVTIILGFFLSVLAGSLGATQKANIDNDIKKNILVSLGYKPANNNLWTSDYIQELFDNNIDAFVMDKNGKILNSWNKVKVKGHVEEVYNFCKDQ